ncbi:MULTISPECIES: phage tail protein [Streptosporangium]|uniref:Phage tail-like protein n=1 Tax=Streptosporangium brasiliense TaxID=47480 RepID=A0ABT9RML7_9ACTN|nr:phage tail protein [Streptosporangium brasiliense]MDP9870323.1 phage tail-like protein [Streptosporangium brasiliense]
MATQATRLKEDPLRSFRFKVVFGGAGTGDRYKFGQAGFMNVSGLSMTTEVIPYREGGMNTTTRKMPGQSDFSPVSMSRGLMVGEPAMMLWMNDLFDALQGSAGSKIPDFRMNIDIYLLAHPWPGPDPIALAGWRLLNAWPTSVAFSDLDAGANSISINQMSLAHEGWYFKLNPDISGTGVVL